MSNFIKPTGIPTFRKSVPGESMAEKAAKISAFEGPSEPRPRPEVPLSSIMMVNAHAAEVAARKDQNEQPTEPEAQDSESAKAFASSKAGMKTKASNSQAKKKKSTYNLRMDQDVEAALSAYVEENLMSQNKLVNTIIREWLVEKGRL